MTSPIASTSRQMLPACRRRLVSTYPSSSSPYATPVTTSGRLRPASTPLHQLPKSFRQPGRAYPPGVSMNTIISKGRAARKAAAPTIAAKREEEERYRTLSRPHPIYGYSPGNERVWLDCDLRRCILDREEVWGIKDVPLADFPVKPSLTDGFELPHATAPAERPEQLQWGVARDGEAATLLFDLLPELNRRRQAREGEGDHLNDFERRKADNMMRLLNLQNGSSQDIHAESRRRILEAFAAKAGDTAGADIEIALLTFKLRTLYTHMMNHPHCRQYIRTLPQLYAKRRRALDRLYRDDVDHYNTLLKRCGIEPRLANAHISWSRTGRHARRKARDEEWQKAHPGWSKPF